MFLASSSLSSSSHPITRLVFPLVFLQLEGYNYIIFNVRFCNGREICTEYNSGRHTRRRHCVDHEGNLLNHFREREREVIIIILTEKKKGENSSN